MLAAEKAACQLLDNVRELVHGSPPAGQPPPSRPEGHVSVSRGPWLKIPIRLASQGVIEAGRKCCSCQGR